jgi:hypothetical protein
MFNKKFWKSHQGYRLYTVDDSQVRASSINNQDFCLVGTSYQFEKLIPKDEIWFSELLDPYEKEIKLRAAMKLIEEMSSGKDFWEAYYRVRKEIENPIRNNHELSLKNEEPRIKLHSNIHGIKVYLVDGRIVRDKYDSGFHEGGHGYVYAYVPKDEIWMENGMVRDHEWQGTLIHEYNEMMLMKTKGYDYNKAHDIVSQEEYKNRTKES